MPRSAAFQVGYESPRNSAAGTAVCLARAVTRYHVLASHGWISNTNGICVPLPRPHAATGGHPLLTAIAAAPARRGSHREAQCRFARPGQAAEERFGVRLQGAPGARALERLGVATR